MSKSTLHRCYRLLRATFYRLFVRLDLWFLPHCRIARLETINSAAFPLLSLAGVSRIGEINAVELCCGSHVGSERTIPESGKILIPKRNAYRVPNARLRFPESVAELDGYFLEESIPTRTYLATAGFYADYLRPHRNAKCKETIMLLGMPYQNNYHLWLQYALPRLMFWESIEDHAQIPCAVSRKSPTYVLQGLAAYKAIRPEFESMLMDRSILTADETIIADPLSCKDLPHPRAVAWLRDTFLKPSSTEHSTKGKIYYITRGTTIERQLINEADLLKRLERYGVSALNMSNLSFEEQIQIFSSALGIIAVHGAALSNLTFAKPSTHVLEIRGGSHFYECYRHLASLVDAKYSFVTGDSVGPHVKLSEQHIKRIEGEVGAWLATNSSLVR